MEDNMGNAVGKVETSPEICELYSKRAELLTQLRLVDDLLEKNKTQPDNTIMANYILAGIYSYYHINEEEFKNKTRKGEVIERKRLAIYLLKNYTKLTLVKIASLVGLKKHETILHHIKEAGYMLSKELWGDVEFQHEYKQLLNYLKLNGDDKKTIETNGH